MSQALSEVCKTDCDFVEPRFMAIPMPPEWNGVRPAEITETYGHPALENKDWRHFENTLRWRFACEGYICDATAMNGMKGIAFIAQKMISCLTGMPDIKKVKLPTEYKHTAIEPTKTYDEFCDECDKFFEGSKIAEQKKITDAYPPALRPIMAMSMCE